MPMITIHCLGHGNWVCNLDGFFNSYHSMQSGAEKQAENIQALIQEKIDTNKDCRSRLKPLPDFVDEKIDYNEVPLTDIIKENDKLWVEIHGRLEHAD